MSSALWNTLTMKKNHIAEQGLTLVELLTAVLIASILILATFNLIKGFNFNVKKVNKAVNDHVNVHSVIDVLTTEIELAGHQPIDSTLPSIFNNGKVLDIQFSKNHIVSRLVIRGDSDSSTRQIITYQFSSVQRPSYTFNENFLIKSKQVTNDSNITTNVYSNQVVLMGVEKLECSPSINPTPVNSNGNVRGVNCTFYLYNSSTDMTKITPYQFYAKASNLQ